MPTNSNSTANNQPGAKSELYSLVAAQFTNLQQIQVD